MTSVVRPGRVYQRHPLNYESRVCVCCDRDYLYPAYGGYSVCNDCKMGGDGNYRWAKKTS